VLVAKSGKVLFERGYGYANVDAKTANTAETRFNIGSIGKLFTHVAVCQLIASGKLEPTDTIGKLLPDYPNAEARAAWERQDIDRAIGLQQRAFRANPNDPEVAGNLAFLYLKARPPRPAQARQVALYALAARGSSFPAGREADWGTFAVASALEGREADAAQALFVMFALSKNPERACRAALLAMAQYGPAMAGPARSMLSRVRGRGSAATAPSCR